MTKTKKSQKENKQNKRDKKPALKDLESKAQVKGGNVGGSSIRPAGWTANHNEILI